MFFGEVVSKSASMQIQQADMDFLTTNGYLTVMQKQEYDQAVAEVANLAQESEELQKETMEESSAEASLKKEEEKTHSIMFHLEGRVKKEAELEEVTKERDAMSKEEAVVAATSSKVNELIQKKSMVDRMVPYGASYVALTGQGMVTLNDLNFRNYRVSDNEFSDFVEESKATSDELRAIVERANFYISSLKTEFPKADPSQLWAVSIGLAKLQGDPNQISQRFLLASAVLLHLKSTLENKMMAAEILTTLRADTSQPTTNSDLQSLSESFLGIESTIRRQYKVPKQLSAGVAATIMAGRRFDGTYPTDRYGVFSKATASCESAAVLSIANSPSDELANKFNLFKSIFGAWGYEASEDSELSSAFLAISDLGPDDVRTKMSIVVDGLKVYLEYPLVAAAILASIPTLEANEVLDLTEKAYSMLTTVALGLQRSELLSLAVRMVHGVRNELVKELDPTAKIAKTPVQFTYSPVGFFALRYPIIVVHSSYHATFGGMQGAHPAHPHGVGGFMG